LRPRDDLSFLLRSSLFFYAISPRIKSAEISSTLVSPTPKSVMNDRDCKVANAIDVSNLDVRIHWGNGSWVTQLLYRNEVLLEGRQTNVEQEDGFFQSFFWFCEEASFLAYEYKARERATAVQRGELVDTEPLKQNSVIGEDGRRMAARSKAKDSRRACKLRIRFRDRAHGTAGVWCVE
jgi:hypothetical protein